MAELQAVDNNMRSKLIFIQEILIPNFEFIEREMKLAQYLIKEDHNISVANRLIDLAS